MGAAAVFAYTPAEVSEGIAADDPSIQGHAAREVLNSMSRQRTLIIVVAAAVVAVSLVAFAILNLPGSSRMSGVVTKPGSASLRVVVDQLGANSGIVVAEVHAPDESWLVAYSTAEGGMSGGLLGYAHVAAGTSTDVLVPIDPKIRLTPQAVITLNADRGVRGTFEFDPSRYDSSPDKPYYVAGVAVQATVTVAFPEMENAFDPSVLPTVSP